MYIVDTGFRRTHKEFQGRVGQGVTLIGTTEQRKGGGEDDNGHGTHVAGIVGGASHGVAQGVTLHPVKVGSEGKGGRWFGASLGLEWVLMTLE